MNNLDNQLKVVNQIKINTAQDAIKVMPSIIALLNQTQTVLLRSSRNDVFRRSLSIVEKKVANGEMKPTSSVKGGEEIQPEQALPVEEAPEANPFEDEKVDEATQDAVKAEIMEVELNTKKDMKKLSKKSKAKKE